MRIFHRTIPAFLCLLAPLCAQQVTGGGASANGLLTNSVTFAGSDTFSAPGAAATPGVSITGAPYTGGSGTTNVPQFYMDQGAVAPATWSAAGTEFGWNLPSGFTGNVFDLHFNGGASLASLNYLGNGSFNALTSTTVVTTGSGAAGVTASCTGCIGLAQQSSALTGTTGQCGIRGDTTYTANLLVNCNGAGTDQAVLATNAAVSQTGTATFADGTNTHAFLNELTNAGVSLVTQTASIAATTLLTATGNSAFEIWWELVCTQTGTGSVSVSFQSTSIAQLVVQTSPTLSLTANSGTSGSACATAGTCGALSGMFYARMPTTAALKYFTTYASTGTYALYITVVPVQEH